MSRLRIRIGAVGSLMAGLIVAACTAGPLGAESPAPASGSTTPPSPAATLVPHAATVTLVDGGCRLDGSELADEVPIRLVMVNEADGQFDVDLWLLDAGHAYSEFASHVADEMGRLEAGDPLLGHPDFADLVAEGSTAIGSVGDLEADVTAGTYAIVCILLDASSVPSGISAVGPIRVGT